MFYQKRYCFRNGINAVVEKSSPRASHYDIRFNDVINGNNFSMFCNGRDTLYHVLKAGVDYLMSERRLRLKDGSSF